MNPRLLVISSAVLLGCGVGTVGPASSPQDSSGPPNELLQGPSCTPMEPGCSANPLPAAGCYVTCDSDSDCASDEACEARSMDPCAIPSPGGITCAACGMEVEVCLPQQPTGCTAMVPGCGWDPLPAAGCYVTCETDADCAAGKSCESRSMDPCTQASPDGIVCAACGMEVKVCL